jgi:hypothetical protein
MPSRALCVGALVVLISAPLIWQIHMASKRGNRNPKAARNRDLGSANEIRLKTADEFANEMIPYLKAATADDCTRPTHRAKWLNDRGIRTQQGNEWRHEGVRRLVRRILKLNS